jgi:hypothetical protein
MEFEPPLEHRPRENFAVDILLLLQPCESAETDLLAESEHERRGRGEGLRRVSEKRFPQYASLGIAARSPDFGVTARTRHGRAALPGAR